MPELFVGCYTLPIRNWDFIIEAEAITLPVSSSSYILPIRNWDLLRFGDFSDLKCLTRYTLPIRNWDSLLLSTFHSTLYPNSSKVSYLTYKELRPILGHRFCSNFTAFYSYTLPIRNWDDYVATRSEVINLECRYTLPIRNWDVPLTVTQPCFSLASACYTLPIRNWDDLLNSLGFALQCSVVLYLIYKELRHIIAHSCFCSNETVIPYL